MALPEPLREHHRPHHTPLPLPSYSPDPRSSSRPQLAAKAAGAPRLNFGELLLFSPLYHHKSSPHTSTNLPVPLLLLAVTMTCSSSATEATSRRCRCSFHLRAARRPSCAPRGPSRPPDHSGRSDAPSGDRSRRESPLGPAASPLSLSIAGKEEREEREKGVGPTRQPHTGDHGVQSRFQTALRRIRIKKIRNAMCLRVFLVQHAHYTGTCGSSYS